jgi:hypothetical protein
VRLRIASVFVVALSMIAGVMGIQAPAATSGPTRTRVRIVMSNSGTAWSTIEFVQTWIAAFYVSSNSVGSEVYRNNDTVGLRGTSPGSATVDLVLDVPLSLDQIQLNIAKDRYGTATYKVLRNNTSPATVADLTNNSTSGDATLSTYVSRSSLVAEGLQIPRVDPRKLVLAFYYPWYQAGSFDSGNWYDQPSSAPWRTDVSGEISGMVDEAMGAGIDGFVYSWDAMGDRAHRLDLLLQAANSRGFNVSLLLELLRFRDSSGNFDMAAIKNVLLQGLQRSTNTSFLRVNGRPVIFVYGAYELGSDRWNQVRQYVSQQGYNPFFIGGHGSRAYGFDGLYIYSPGEMDGASVVSKYGDWAAMARLQSQVDPTNPQRLWAATVSPGFNDSYYHDMDSWNSTNVARRGGDRYDETWNAAVWSQAEWILVTSWNEWYEASQIQPSQRFGSGALDQTRSWAAGFHGVAPSGSGSETSTNEPLLQRVLPLGRQSSVGVKPSSSAVQAAWISLLLAG